jgi:hypothetical protein
MPHRSRSNRCPSCRRSRHDRPTPRHRRNCRKRFEGGEGGRCRVGIDGAKVAAEPRAPQALISPFAIPRHPDPVSPAPFFPQGVAAALFTQPTSPLVLLSCSRLVRPKHSQGKHAEPLISRNGVAPHLQNHDTQQGTSNSLLFLPQISVRSVKVFEFPVASIFW